MQMIRAATIGCWLIQAGAAWQTEQRLGKQWVLQQHPLIAFRGSAEKLRQARSMTMPQPCCCHILFCKIQGRLCSESLTCDQYACTSKEILSLSPAFGCLTTIGSMQNTVRWHSDQSQLAIFWNP